jgi:hypothetical protein
VSQPEAPIYRSQVAFCREQSPLDHLGARQQVGAAPYALVAETAEEATNASNVSLAGITGLSTVIASSRGAR